MDREAWQATGMECYSTIKKNEIMSFTAICMDQETMILSEVSQKENSNTVY